MMEYTSQVIIETLRHCGSHKGCETCPVRSDFGVHCMNIMLAAADKLEAAQNQIEHLEEDLRLAHAAFVCADTDSVNAKKVRL